MYVMKRQYYHHLGIILLEENDFCLSICGNYHTYKVEVLHNRHAQLNDVITLYDIINFHSEIIYWII